MYYLYIFLNIPDKKFNINITNFKHDDFGDIAVFLQVIKELANSLHNHWSAFGPKEPMLENWPIVNQSF